MKLLLIALLLVGCTPPGEKVGEGGTYVWHDDQRNVTCWIFKESYKGGIDCISDHELRPDQ